MQSIRKPLMLENEGLFAKKYVLLALHRCILFHFSVLAWEILVYQLFVPRMCHMN